MTLDRIAALCQRISNQQRVQAELNVLYGRLNDILALEELEHRVEVLASCPTDLPPIAQADDPVLTTAEACQMLRVGERHFLKLKASGLIKHQVQGNKHLFRKSVLEAFLQRNPQEIHRIMHAWRMKGTRANVRKGKK